MGLGQGFPASLTPSQGLAGTGREKRRSPRGGSANGIFVNDENEDPPGVFLEKVLVTQRTNSAPIVHGHLFFEIQTERRYILWDLYFPISTPVSMATSGLRNGSVLGHINGFRYQHYLLSISYTVLRFSHSVLESLFLSVFHILYFCILYLSPEPEHFPGLIHFISAGKENLLYLSTNLFFWSRTVGVFCRQDFCVTMGEKLVFSISNIHNGCNCVVSWTSKIMQSLEK